MSIHNAGLAALRQRLAQAGFRLTPQRWSVWSALQGLGGHPSAERLYREVRRAHPMISRATVYKALALLCQVGLVTALPGADGAARFDLGPPHVNLACLRCGRIQDAVDAGLLAAVQRVAWRRGFRVEGGVVVQGTCSRCAAKSGHRKRDPRPHEGREAHG